MFHVPERTDEAPKRSLPSREVKRYKYKGLKGYMVKPFIDTVVECKATVALAPQRVSGAGTNFTLFVTLIISHPRFSFF